eukprot:Nk52_evm4s223 gene=Nk52_evmTU4s223
MVLQKGLFDVIVGRGAGSLMGNILRAGEEMAARASFRLADFVRGDGMGFQEQQLELAGVSMGGMQESGVEKFSWLDDWKSGLLLAVPKQKTSAMKKRIRNAPKFLRLRTDISTCPQCGYAKLLNMLCMNCLKKTRREKKDYVKRREEETKLMQSKE